MDPQPVIPLDYAKETRPPGFWHRFARRLVPVSWVIALAAWGLIFYETESVIFSGPVLFTAGLLMIVSGALARQPGVILLGAGHSGICLLFVGLVNLLSWGPSDAHQPFLFMGAFYLGGSGAMTLLVLFGRAARNRRGTA